MAKTLPQNFMLSKFLLGTSTRRYGIIQSLTTKTSSMSSSTKRTPSENPKKWSKTSRNRDEDPGAKEKISAGHDCPPEPAVRMTFKTRDVSIGYPGVTVQR